MLRVEQVMNIKELSKDGVPIRQIAEMTGHSRNTVRKVLRGEHELKYQGTVSGRANAATYGQVKYSHFERKAFAEDPSLGNREGSSWRIGSKWAKYWELRVYCNAGGPIVG